VALKELVGRLKGIRQDAHGAGVEIDRVTSGGLPEGVWNLQGRERS